MSVENLLRDVSAELKAVRAARERYTVKLSPDFNCFDYIEPDELRLSQILADLVDPRGSHAQDCRFLDAFLQRIGLGGWTDKPVQSVKIEDRTTAIDRARRVDIRICWTDRWELVIENKPWANDGKDQLRDYINDLVNRTGQCLVTDWHIVYLGGTSAEPDEKSLPAQDRDRWVRENKLTLTTYGDLMVPWLTECMGLCESDRFRWFLGEFKAYVLAEFKGERDMAVRNAVAQQIIKSSDNVEAAFEIHAVFDDVRRKLLESLHRDLKHLVNGKGWHLTWDIKCGRDPYKGFNIYFKTQNQRYWLRFQFEKTQFRDFFLGIGKESGTPELPEICDVMQNAGLPFGKGRSDKTWQWYGNYFGDELRSWNASSIPWKRICDGTLAKDLFGLIEKVHEAFDRAGQLELLCG